jgi:hypothetical protein
MALHMILHVIVDSIATGAPGAQGDLGAPGPVPPGCVSNAVTNLLKPALMTFGNIQCTYEPAGNLDELIAQSLGAKMKFTKRQRPHPMQLWRILSRKVDADHTGNEAAKSRVELFQGSGRELQRVTGTGGQQDQQEGALLSVVLGRPDA